VETIDEVVAALDGIISRSEATESRLGYFPALYRKVTLEVQRRIAAGEFDDGARMSRLVVTFASRYLDALERYEQGTGPTESWCVCFEAAEGRSLIVLQHLLLGMNAHINLDLGIAAVETAGSAGLASLQGDFNRINKVLQSLIDDVNDDLTQVWPPLRVLNIFGRTASGRVTDFSMRQARDHAWNFAQALAALPADARVAAIHEQDAEVALLAQLVRRPPLMMRLLLRAIRLRERGSVADRIRWLAT